MMKQIKTGLGDGGNRLTTIGECPFGGSDRLGGRRDWHRAHRVHRVLGAAVDSGLSPHGQP